MDKIAKSSDSERLSLFRDVSVNMGIPFAMVEKDFWSCWALSKLFSDSELSQILFFKGGTSLSKSYNLIKRFSEDLDIILDKKQVLNEGEELFQSSIKKQRLFAEEISKRTSQYINTMLKNKMTEIFNGIVKIYTDEEYAKANKQYAPKIIDDKNLHIVYPKTENDMYLRPDILLEISIMSANVPNEPREILPYVAKLNPQLGVVPAIVSTVKAERTFWDKATILHREFYRSKTKLADQNIEIANHTPARYSRHYYDLYQMGNSWVKAVALANAELLADVANRKDKLYHCAWARYDLAKPGTLRLLPNENNRPLLAKDYQDMQGMIFGDKLDWETILEYLQKLEEEINGL
jgi:hypothetical protein